MQHAKRQEPARVAVYDFDNTSLDCSSTVRLVFYLLKSSYLSLGTSLKIGFWGLAYKLRLPQNESWVRGQVFKAFAGRPKRLVDQFLAKYYDEVLEKHFRAAAHASMHEHLAAGIDVLMVSASFEPIVQRAMQRHGFTGQVSTRMKVAPDGTYTREVDGLPVEGAEKIEAIKRWCDERYGEGGWKIVAAFGDHHSDEAMLACAEKSYAVNPNSLLEKIAKDRGWTILDWDAKGTVTPVIDTDDAPDADESHEEEQHAGSAFADVEEYEPKSVELWPEIEEITPEEFPPEDADMPSSEEDAAPAFEQSATVRHSVMPSVRDARGVASASNRPSLMTELTGKMAFVSSLGRHAAKVEDEIEEEVAPPVEAEPIVEDEPPIEIDAEDDVEVKGKHAAKVEIASEPEPEVEAEAEPGPESAPEPVPEPEAKVEAEPESEPKPKPKRKAKAESEAGLEAETKPKRKRKPKAEPEAGLEAETKPKRKRKPKAEANPVSEAELKLKPKRKSKSKPETEPELNPEAEPAPKPKRKRKAKSDSESEPAPEPKPKSKRKRNSKPKSEAAPADQEIASASGPAIAPPGQSAAEFATRDADGLAVDSKSQAVEES